MWKPEVGNKVYRFAGTKCITAIHMKPKNKRWHIISLENMEHGVALYVLSKMCPIALCVAFFCSVIYRVPHAGRCIVAFQ